MQLLERISDLQPIRTGHELIRIGPDRDEGYLVPDDLDGIAACFSPGVSTVADFEAQLAADWGMPCYLADGTVDGPPTQNPLFQFIRKNIGTVDTPDLMTLESWVNGVDGLRPDQDLLLQMNIEGSEYDALVQAPMALLRRFRIIVVEFHNVADLMLGPTHILLTALLRKLRAEFSVAHLHANNVTAPTMARGIDVPKLLEVTFLRNDRIIPGGPVPGPLHPLDRPNVDGPPIVLSAPWWPPQDRQNG